MSINATISGRLHAQGLIKLKKKRAIQKFDNVFVFPGTSEILLRDAQTFAENAQYELAVEKFEAALQLVAGDEHTLSVYAFALYEIRQFDKAKEVCEQLLEIGPAHYFEAMELYLTICMQLKQFEQVNKIIESLLEEDLVPNDRIEKFERLRNLNAEIAENRRLQESEVFVEDQIDEFSATDFLSLTPHEQLIFVNTLTSINIRPFAKEMKTVLEHQETHVFIKSLLLILLVEQGVQMEIQVAKFGKRAMINPSDYPLPTQLPMFQEIMDYMMNELDKEPSIEELAQHLITKHAIVLYPFQWDPFEVHEVATSYIHLVKMMFGELHEMNDACFQFIQQLEHLDEI